MDNALKTIFKTDDQLITENYIVLFGGRDLEGVASPQKNADGTNGQYFTKATALASNYTDTGALYVDWEHGAAPDGEPQRDDVLGTVDWKTARIDEKGVFVQRVLNRRNQYMQYLEELIDAGLIGNSSEAIPEGVEIGANGEIKAWPLKRDTLTVSPMEPRMMQENVMQAAKALGLLTEPEPETEPEASNGGDVVTATIDNWQDSTHKNMEVITMPAEQVTTQTPPDVDAIVAAAATKAADTAVKAYQERLENEPPTGVKALGSVTHDEADTPFQNLAAQCQAVKAYELSHGQRVAPRLNALKAILGANEMVPAQGGFLLDPTLTSEIITPVHEAGPFAQRVRKLPVSSNSNYGWINGVDESSRATGSRWGGIRGYRLAEGATKTGSKPTFRRINWELQKYAIAVTSSDELLQDAAQFSAVVGQGSREELGFMLNDDILNGPGTAGPLGVLQSGALNTIDRETGQGATIVYSNLSKMWMGLSIRSKNSPTTAWYINAEVAPELDDLFIAAGTAGIPPRFVTERPDGSGYNIKGKPVIETEFNEALGTVGDIVLSDMSEYLLWQKGDIQFASSIHVEFLTDQTLFRFVMRVDGKPTMASTITPYKATGSRVVSAHVALAAPA